MGQLPDERIYYAQNREDLIIESFFPDIKKGFYVDVGACHPHVASVTKRFYLRGWLGINIEPQANLFGLFVRDRKRDINLNLGVGNTKGSLILRSYIHNQGLSSVVDSVKSEHESSVKNSELFEDLEIEIATLKDVLSSCKVTTIHFLKVDVEGYEYEVLEGNDWSVFRPEVICIEANHVVKNWRDLLIKNKYEKIFFDGLNEYYADSTTDRGAKFNYVDHVVTGLKGGISADDFERLEKARREKDEQTRITALLEAELQSIKKMIKRVRTLLPAKLRSRLNKR